MKRYFNATLTVLLSILNLGALSQPLITKSYTWEKHPVIRTMSDEEKPFPGVILLSSQFTEVQRIVGAPPVSYHTEHKIIHINSDAGIEKYNKVYIPLRSSYELIDLQVRSIDPAGKITNLRKENLKELTNVDGYRNFKIFAIEGVAVGGEVEYIYTIKAPAQLFGREMLQSDVPTRSAAYVLIYPKLFEYKAKSYNGLASPTYGAYDDKRNIISVAAVNIPALAKEEFSSENAEMMRIDFKMEYNGVTTGFFDWPRMSLQLARNYYDAKDVGKAAKLLKEIGFGKLEQLEQIKKLEQYIKTNFTLKEGSSDAYEDLKEILAKRVANETGMMKLYVACLSLLEIEADLVFTCPREFGSIDESFSSPMDLRDMLLYFPQYKKYLAPTVNHLRFGPAPDDVGGNEGLFITTRIDNAGIVVSNYFIRKIELLSHEHNKLGVNAAVQLVNGVAAVQHETFWQGYRAAQYRGVYRNLSGADREEFVKAVTLSGIDNVTVKNRVIEGENINLSIDPDSYFKIKTTYDAPSIVEKAGEDLLISLGKLIGKQAELYNEKERMTNIRYRSISNYNHTLTLEIPDGYSCSGQEAARIQHEVKNEDGEIVMSFDSDYRIEENKLIVTVNEVYKVVFLQKEKYSDFRAVVNSAADFNKVVVVLSPVQAD